MTTYFTKVTYAYGINEHKTLYTDTNNPTIGELLKKCLQVLVYI